MLTHWSYVFLALTHRSVALPNNVDYEAVHHNLVASDGSLLGGLAVGDKICKCILLYPPQVVQTGSNSIGQHPYVPRQRIMCRSRGLFLLSFLSWHNRACQSTLWLLLRQLSRCPISKSSHFYGCLVLKWVAVIWHGGEGATIVVLAVDARGPFYWHGLTLIPAWISNHVSSKLWDEITYPFQTSTVALLKFGIGSIISSHTS